MVTQATFNVHVGFLRSRTQAIACANTRTHQAENKGKTATEMHDDNSRYKRDAASDPPPLLTLFSLPLELPLEPGDPTCTHAHMLGCSLVRAVLGMPHLCIPITMLFSQYYV